MGGAPSCCSTATVTNTDEIVVKATKTSMEAVEFDEIANELKRMNIVEFETRLKHYASIENKGYINQY